MKYRYNTTLLKDMPVIEVAKIAMSASKIGIENVNKPTEITASCVYMWNEIKGLRFTPEGTGMTIEKLLKICEDARIAFGDVHRVNYMLFTTMVEVLDYLEDKKVKASGLKKSWNMSERVFNEYLKAHGESLKKEVWVTFKDFMRRATDYIIPYIKGLESIARNYIIFHKPEWKGKQLDNVDLLVIVSTALMFERVRKYTYQDFITRHIREDGVNLASEFKYAELSKMSLFFVDMCKAAGVKIVKNIHGDYQLSGITLEDSGVYSAKWEGMIRALKDDEMIEKAGEEAINLNPAIQKEYEEALNEIESNRQ